ncbi:MAG TPA: glycosyltransferase family 39 protein [Anaerolineales bacterium]|nr:glycosyltransferase family 39 protein [Anaerolineales bacterium]
MALKSKHPSISGLESISPPRKLFRFAWQELAWHFLPPLVYFVIMLGFSPYWDMFWIYSDEGFEVMKALLVSRGFSLFSQVWSDQPPLHTELLALIFRINGPGVFAARLLTLCFTCLLIWALVQMVRLAWSNWAALAAAVFLLLLPAFPSLSVAALTGQPALALACVSLLGLFYWHRRPSWFVLVFSGSLMGLSLLTKAFTGILIPIFGGVFLFVEHRTQPHPRNLWRTLWPALVWGSSILLSALGLSLLLVGPENLWQLIQPHVAAARSTAYPSNEQLYSIWFYLRDAWTILLLAIAGIGIAFSQRRMWMAYPAVWMLAAMAVLSIYRPIWSHHQLLVTIPAAMLAGGAAAEGVRWLAGQLKGGSILHRESILYGSTLVLALITLAVRWPDVVSQFEVPGDMSAEPRSAYEDRVMRRINEYAPQTRWMVTDLPMYAFRAGLLTPPNLAVISWKRLAARDLTEAEILETIQELEPEQILFGRFRFDQVEDYIQEDYFPVLEREDQLKLYIRKDLLK